jgi:hypothetical protein
MISIRNSLNNQKGAVIIIVALLLVVLLGIAAFAIDIGYGRVVRNQLQNASDAAALAACNRFYSRSGGLTSTPDPDWSAAANEAASAITDNKADNKQLKVGTAEFGWWDITQAYPGVMWPDPLTTPPLNTPPTENYGPAVRVTITKEGAQNDGPISSFFGKILGILFYNNRATATAVAASPGSVRPGSVIPVALAKEVVDDFFHIHDTENNPIAIGSPYHYPNNLAGQWTSFMMDTNNTPDVAELITHGNPSALGIGDDIWINPGVKDTLYDSFPQGNIDDVYGGKDVYFPIVDATIRDTTHSAEPIAGFVGFHIICAGKGCNDMTIIIDGITYNLGTNPKVIVGYFTTAPSYGGPIGPHYGPLDRCRLCQ